MDLAIIIRYMPMLSVFRAPGVQLPSSAFEALAAVSGPSLRELSVEISPDNGEAAVQLMFLGHFPALRCLDLDASDLEDISELGETNTPALNMPYLDTLRVRCRGNHPRHVLLAFFSRGQFPVLQELMLDLPLTSPACEALGPLVGRVNHRLGTLSLHSNLADEGARTLLPLLTELRELVFCDPPRWGFIDCLPPMIDRLIYHVQFDDPVQGRGLVQSLDQILLAPKTRIPSLAVVRLTASGSRPDRFLWSTIAETNIAVAGQLMAKSMDLAEKGIRVIDEELKWLGLRSHA
ncbi:hypothetical protein DACRYDRAFT_25530 [Dacryopinax primogenitus]|uniref:RNI-like protein n=1 Tax=Dacryopinax primogenitus (strain DJM 731) TaxID=1858805 RepID=M5FN25_DACPD|nr:uncharacterized protein DACRYDRAFT_25530 [Dacryopinax primogenitus]EJT96705.1 hypothetical protein DACRYDRAFT_25530 [Dacryopinax primogenitus]